MTERSAKDQELITEAAQAVLDECHRILAEYQPLVADWDAYDRALMRLATGRIDHAEYLRAALAAGVPEDLALADERRILQRGC